MTEVKCNQGKTKKQHLMTKNHNCENCNECRKRKNDKKINKLRTKGK